MHAELDTPAKQLKSTEAITYTNNSPDTSTSLWLQLEQNTYRKDSRANNWTFDMAVDKVAGAKLPVETWYSRTSFVRNLEGGKPIASVVVNPDQVLPDDDRTNNEKKVE